MAASVDDDGYEYVFSAVKKCAIVARLQWRFADPLVP